MLTRRSILTGLAAVAAPPVRAQAPDKLKVAITRLMQVYAKAIDWAYTNSRAIDYFAEGANVPRDIAKQAVDEFFPKEALQIGGIRGLETTLRDALQYKFTTRQLTPTDVEALIDIVFKPAS